MSWPKVLLVTVCLSVAAWAGYRSWQVTRWTHLTGETMGTTYQIHFQHPWFVRLNSIEDEIKSLLSDVNKELSTWDQNSWISEFNRAPAGVDFPLPPHALEVLACSLKLAEASGGAFDPACFPLVRLWGFGPDRLERIEEPGKETIRQLLEFCSYRNIRLDISSQYVSKAADGAQIDCSGLAKGYAIDQIAAILEDRVLKNYSIEIGGEVRAGGKDPAGQSWKVKLATPSGFWGDVPVLTLSDQSIATSGGSQVYKTIGDTVYSHIVDPRTGYPLSKNLSCFSASVIAPNCMLADALATAAFVLGPEQSMILINEYPECIIMFLMQDADRLFVVKKGS